MQRPARAAPCWWQRPCRPCFSAVRLHCPADAAQVGECPSVSRPRAHPLLPRPGRRSQSRPPPPPLRRRHGRPSTTRQALGCRPSMFAAFRKTSGSGLECVMPLPSETASKYVPRPMRSRMKGAFLLEEPMASFSPLARSASSVVRTSPERSCGPHPAQQAAVDAVLFFGHVLLFALAVLGFLTFPGRFPGSPCGSRRAGGRCRARQRGMPSSSASAFQASKWYWSVEQMTPVQVKDDAFVLHACPPSKMGSGALAASAAVNAPVTDAYPICRRTGPRG